MGRGLLGIKSKSSYSPIRNNVGNTEVTPTVIFQADIVAFPYSNFSFFFFLVSDKNKRKDSFICF